MKIHEKIEKGLSLVVACFRSLGYITAKWDIEETDEIPTMGVTYRKLLYNPSYVEKLEQPYVSAVLLHEVVHCLLLHPSEITKEQAKGKDHSRWVVALEVVTNAVVKEFSRQYEKVFVLPGKAYSPISRCYVADGRTNNAEGIYFYDFLGSEKTAPEIYKMIPDDLDTRMVDFFSDILPADVNADQQDAVEAAIAVLSNLKKAGTLPGKLERFLGKLVNSKVKWERVLHSWVGQIVSGADDFQWERPNHKQYMAKGLIFPGHVSNEMDLVVVFDTSGTISSKPGEIDGYLLQFASEFAKISQYVPQATVVTTDTEVHEKVAVHNIMEFLKSIKFIGGGGTDFRPVFNEIKRCDAMVFFTDGYARYPEKKPSYPVLWVLTPDHEKPPFGKIIVLPD